MREGGQVSDVAFGLPGESSDDHVILLRVVRPPQRGLDATRHGVVPRERKGEPRRGIARFAGRAATEKRGHRGESKQSAALALKP